mmetsp:Transcript_23164/g.36230  ORF Transcript_23164/g.36230 Transcript_23164/m.36230 type:complete len:228 (-) Transcript_23164:508-1191(-)
MQAAKGLLSAAQPLNFSAFRLLGSSAARPWISLRASAPLSFSSSKYKVQDCFRAQQSYTASPLGRRDPASDPKPFSSPQTPPLRWLTGPGSYDPSSGDRNLGGWKPGAEEKPATLPERYWRGLAEDTLESAKRARKSSGPANAGVQRKRLAWACKKRGWVEMEVLLKEFAESPQGLARVPDAELEHLERILLADDMFLMALLTGKKPVPDEFQGPAMNILVNFTLTV